MHETILLLAQKRCETKDISDEECCDRVEHSLDIAEESYRILSLYPVWSVEGKMAKTLQGTLLQFQQSDTFN